MQAALAMLLPYVSEPIVTRTAGRLFDLSAATASGGTGMPDAGFPFKAITARNLMGREQAG